MYGTKDRVLLQAVYAKLCAIEQRLIDQEIAGLGVDELPFDEDFDDSPYLNDDGLYSFKAYKSKLEAEKLGRLGSTN